MKFYLSFLMIFIVGSVFGNDIFIKNTKADASGKKVSFVVGWKNSWKNDKNFDAAWVFVKLRTESGVTHARLASKGHSIQKGASSKGELFLPQDRVGIFVQPSQTHRGDVEWSVELTLDSQLAGATPEVYAIEMVYIPRSPFFIGGTDQEALKYSSFYKSDADGKPADLFKIAAENQSIKVEPTEGNLYYRVGNSPYRGDMKGSVPSSFPKGYDPFYMMKYETTQGLYTDFLNTLPSELAASLSPDNVEGYNERRGSIKLEEGKYTSVYNRPANYITWDDGAAMADWAGLRPMTELEYTKAARGPVKPEVHDFPWGSASTDQLKRKVELNDELILVGVDEKDLNESNREVYGASYYWVMDLAGSLWEKCVTVGHPIGRNFKGTHGDGVLSPEGTATNSDWPKGIAEEGGYGYRGGGYYNHGMKISDYNPHSPVAYRPYGSWAGGKRSIAYSQRYVRTAK